MQPIPYSVEGLRVEIDELLDERSRLAIAIATYLTGGLDVPVGLMWAFRLARIALRQATDDLMYANAGVGPAVIGASRAGLL